MNEAVVRLRTGKLVALPTETVYGLGADARNPDAVAQIFAVKGRPATNPLIVHVADADAARALAGEWPDAAEKLAARFWPGPLTLVVPKTDAIPDVVTAGGATVALRVPSHPVALELLRRSGVPVAAPSANRSEEVSPTLAQHVADSLGPYADDLLILDGGRCEVGLESTVLDVTCDPPRVLRPGMVTAVLLREIVGEVSNGAAAGAGPARSPGQRERHYAPRKPVVVVPREQLKANAQPGDSVIPLHWKGMYSTFDGGGGLIDNDRTNAPEKYAASLYFWLRFWDQNPTTRRIVVEEPPHGPEWEAIHDRLRRATAAQGDGK